MEWKSAGVPRTENSTHDFDRRHTSRESLDGVDVEPLGRNLGRHTGYLTRREPSAKQGDNPSVLALTAPPLVILADADRREPYGHVELCGLEKQLLHYIAAYLRCSLDEYAQRERVVDVGLAYVQDTGVIFGQNLRESPCYARMVLARYVDEDEFELRIVH